MGKKQRLFSASERRIAFLALIAAALLTGAIMLLERALTPSLGLYGTNVSAPSLPDVIDARPMSRSAAL
jgi:hypothetical protein